MSEAMYRIARCADGTEGFATLTRDECVSLLAVWVAANQVVGFHAPDIKRDEEVDRWTLALRKALRDKR